MEKFPQIKLAPDAGCALLVRTLQHLHLRVDLPNLYQGGRGRLIWYPLNVSHDLTEGSTQHDQIMYDRCEFRSLQIQLTSSAIEALQDVEGRAQMPSDIQDNVKSS